MAGVFDDPSMLFSNTTWCRCLGGREAHLTSNNVLCRLYHSVQCFAVEGGAVPTPDSVAANRDVLHSACIKLFEGLELKLNFLHCLRKKRRISVDGPCEVPDDVNTEQLEAAKMVHQHH